MGDSPLRDAHRAQEKAGNARATEDWHKERMNFGKSGGSGGSGGGGGGGKGCLVLLSIPGIITGLIIGLRVYFS